MNMSPGYDTTANTIIYACIILALYPGIQRKILDEVRRFHKVEASEVAKKTSSEYLAMFPYLLAFMVRVSWFVTKKKSRLTPYSMKSCEYFLSSYPLLARLCQTNK